MFTSNTQTYSEVNKIGQLGQPQSGIWGFCMSLPKKSHSEKASGVVPEI